MSTNLLSAMQTLALKIFSTLDYKIYNNYNEKVLLFLYS